MRKVVPIAVLTNCLLSVVASLTSWSAPSHADDGKAPSQLCVVWTSGDPVWRRTSASCTRTTQRRETGSASFTSSSGGLLPSSWPRTKNPERNQGHDEERRRCGGVRGLRKNYGVVDELKKLGIDVKGMGQPLTDRLKGNWKVLTF